SRVGGRVEEADGQALRCIMIIGDIQAAAANEMICAQLAAKKIAICVADQRSIEFGTDKTLDGSVGIAHCLTGIARRVGKVDGEATGGAAVIRVVKTCAAVEMIGTESAAQDVTVSVANQRVVKVGAY